MVDHPSDKAGVDFIIRAPLQYRIVASGVLVEESIMPDFTMLTHWKEEIPLPVKVMTLRAAPFAVRLSDTAGDIPVWSWVFSGNREEGFNDYSIAVKPLQFYVNLIGPYPYKNLANVQSKTIFGGLENAGCIFYSENSVTGQGRAEGLIAHEIAHQWFGDCVNEKNWHHIWLNEGIATYLTAVYMEKTYSTDRLKEIMRSARDRVLRAQDRDPSPVIDTTIVNLMELLNANSYQKGSWVLHMMRNELGDSTFWKGIRLYYNRFRNGNALTADLMDVMEEVSGRKLERFFNQWLYIAGQPVLKISLASGEAEGTMKIIIEQKQEHLFSFPLEILLNDSMSSRIEKIMVSERITTFKVKAEPDLLITPDPGVRLLYKSL